MSRTIIRCGLVLMGLVPLSLTGLAQGGRGGQAPDGARAAQQLDVAGKTKEARAIFQQMADTADTPLAKAQAHRNIAMSYAFDGDCANTIKYEEMVIAYWVTREQAEPQNAFYQQGEMANEGARVCIDVGELVTAEKYYRRGSELGLKEPAPRTHPKSLWDFRLTHALARLAARRGNEAEARKQLAEARRILDSDPEMAKAQERFYPYLHGYVELYLGHAQAALDILLKTVVTPGNTNDPFMHALLAMAYEKLGDAANAKAYYQKAYDLATSHNPPAAFARPFARKKLGL